MQMYTRWLEDSEAEHNQSAMDSLAFTRGRGISLALNEDSTNLSGLLPSLTDVALSVIGISRTEIYIAGGLLLFLLISSFHKKNESAAANNFK
jgi:hypothetical protein